MGGILGDDLGEGNCESKIVSRQWGDNFCPETSRCLAGPSGKQSRLKISTSLEKFNLDLSTRNRGLLGGSLEIYIFALGIFNPGGRS